MSTQLSEHFSLAELTASDTATARHIDNTPDAATLVNLRHLAERLEMIRGILGKPMPISSGYRCPALNRAVGGAANSAHLTGLAADFTSPGFGTPLSVCKLLAHYAEQLDFDQLIYESTWVHVGFAPPGKAGRREVLTAHFGPGGVTYTHGLG